MFKSPCEEAETVYRLLKLSLASSLLFGLSIFITYWLDIQYLPFPDSVFSLFIVALLLGATVLFLFTVPLAIVLYLFALVIKNQTLKKQIKKMSILMTFALIIIGGSIFNFNASVLSLFKIGSVKNASVAADRPTCELIKRNRTSLTCSENESAHLIENIDILWRVGEYYLRFEGADDKQHSIRVAKKHIKGVIFTGK